MENGILILDLSQRSSLKKIIESLKDFSNKSFK
jgi:hypothetical protein